MHCRDCYDEEDLGQNLDYSDEELLELFKSDEEDDIDLDELQRDYGRK
jgi:hypothetical protein